MEIREVFIFLMYSYVYLHIWNTKLMKLERDRLIFLDFFPVIITFQTRFIYDCPRYIWVNILVIGLKLQYRSSVYISTLFKCTLYHRSIYQGQIIYPYIKPKTLKNIYIYNRLWWEDHKVCLPSDLIVVAFPKTRTRNLWLR